MSGLGKGGSTAGRKMPCPECGKPAGGNFCQSCGATLGGRFCNQCGAKLSGGARFCNQCGAKASRKAGAPDAGVGHRAAASAAFGGANTPWWIAGVAMFGLILVVGWSMVRAGPPPTPGGAPTGATVPPGGQAPVDLSSMSPQEAANRLFNRVMSTLEAGDTAGAIGFQPMAIQAYEMLEPLDLDGLFHLAMLQILVDPSAALVTADRILEVETDHVLGLGMAAQAALRLGDEEQAAAHYQHLLDVFDAQVARPLPEYQGHQPSLTQMQSAARAFLAGR
jgi:hypothetical protein